MHNTITVGGRQYPVAFTMSALANFTTQQGITLGGLFKMLGYGSELSGKTEQEIGASLLFNSQLTLTQIVEVTKFALNAGANAEKEKKKYTTEEVAQLFDEKDGLLLEILQLLLLSVTKMFAPAEEEQGSGDDQKKAKAKAAKTG